MRSASSCVRDFFTGRVGTWGADMRVIFFYNDTQKGVSYLLYLKKNKDQYKRWTIRHTTTSKKYEYTKDQCPVLQDYFSGIFQRTNSVFTFTTKS